MHTLLLSGYLDVSGTPLLPDIDDPLWLPVPYIHSLQKTLAQLLVTTDHLQYSALR